MRDSVFFAQIPTLVIDLSLDIYTDCTYLYYGPLKLVSGTIT